MANFAIFQPSYIAIETEDAQNINHLSLWGFNGDIWLQRKAITATDFIKEIPMNIKLKVLLGFLRLEMFCIEIFSPAKLNNAKETGKQSSWWLRSDIFDFYEEKRAP